MNSLSVMYCDLLKISARRFSTRPLLSLSSTEDLPEWVNPERAKNSGFRSHPVEHRRGQRMQIGKPLRTVVVEPLQLPVKQPTGEPEPVAVPEPEQEPVPVQVPVAS